MYFVIVLKNTFIYLSDCDIRAESSRSPPVIYFQRNSHSVSSTTSSSSSSSSSGHDTIESTKIQNLKAIPEAQVWLTPSTPPAAHTPPTSSPSSNASVRSKKSYLLPRTGSSANSVNTDTTGYVSEVEQAV